MGYLSTSSRIPLVYVKIMFVAINLGKLQTITLYIISGTLLSICIFVILPDIQWLQLVIYLAGKFGATAAFTVIYVITSEIFPTPLRHSLMGACSMFGRIGSMVSPQMPLLSQIWKPLPLVLFGIMATIAGFLSLLFPETLNTKLPDTIEEAENIGKSTESLRKSSTSDKA